MQRLVYNLFFLRSDSAVAIHVDNSHKNETAFFLDRLKLSEKPISCANRSITMEPNLSICDILPDTAFEIIFRFVGAHDLQVDWNCIACNPYWYGWHCPGCHIPLRFLLWTPRYHYGYCGPKCGCCLTAWGYWGCLACYDLYSWKVTSRNAREQLRQFDGR